MTAAIPDGEPTPGPWYVHANDLIGGWSVMNVDKPPSQCDFRIGEWEVATFVRREDAELIVALRNGQATRPFVERCPKCGSTEGTTRTCPHPWHGGWAS